MLILTTNNDCFIYYFIFNLMSDLYYNNINTVNYKNKRIFYLIIHFYINDINIIFINLLLYLIFFQILVLMNSFQYLNKMFPILTKLFLIFLYN